MLSICSTAITVHPFNGLLFNLDLLQQETVSGSDIICAICKSALRRRHITMPAPHHWQEGHLACKN